MRRVLAALLLLGGVAAAQPVVVGDAIPARSPASPGDAARGRAIVLDRQRGLCLLCHSGPFPEERFQGDLAPSLAGAGPALSEGQLRLRMVDGRRLNPDTIMPSYFSLDGLVRVGRAWQGKTVLTAEEIEDVVAFLATLRDLIAAALLGGLLAIALVRPAGATPEALEEAILDFTKGVAPRPGGVVLDIPPLVENGNTVPVSSRWRAR